VTTHTLNVRGLTCPVPLLRTKKRLATMQPGEVLEVIATDPETRTDFVAFCDGTTCVLLSASEEERVYRFLIRRV
jgi:tRNA 2-thiouridine synthesizing protein A